MKRKSSKNSISADKVKWIIAVNLVLIFLFALAFGREYVSTIQVNREIARLEAERDALRGQNADTVDLIQDLSTELYLEEQARLKYNLVEPGEEVYIFKDSQDETRVGIETEFVVEENTTPAEDWFRFFFGN